MNKHFNKNLIMSEEEYLFQQSNSCWICKKLIDNDEEKVRDHCHENGKFRGAAHWYCNINFQLTKIVPVIFQNLRGCGSHLVSNELDKFDVNINAIPNGLEKYMAYFFFNVVVFRNEIDYIHRVLKFKQSDWIKKCIDFNTKKRMIAANDFEKDFFKINDQFCLWKTMENV